MSSVKQTCELWKEEQVIVGAVNKMWLKCLGWKGPYLFGIWLARDENEGERKEREREEKVVGGGEVGLRLGEEEDVDEVSMGGWRLGSRDIGS